MNKNSFHCRNRSGELDVFEATRYFSTSNDQAPANRRSLDMPRHHHVMIMDHQNKEMNKKNKKFMNQPTSPGGRLASFLSSLFKQSNSKKKVKATPTSREKKPPHTNTPTKAYKINHGRDYKITLLDEIHSERINRVMRVSEEDHDGADSDSSSDLFDLPNLHDFDFLSGGLPVYNVDRINIVAPISLTF